MKFDIKKIRNKIIDFYNARRRLVWIGTGVLVVSLIMLVFFIPGDTSSQESVQYAEVIQGSVTESIGEVGTVEAEPSAVLTWRSDGIVAEYDLKVGDAVSKDEALMELEFSSWPNESLEAQSDLLEAELTLENMLMSNSDLQTALQAAVDADWAVWDTKQMRDYWNYAESSDYRLDAIRANYMEAVQNVWIYEAEYESLRATSEEDDPELIEAYEAYQTADLERDKYLRALNQALGTSYNIVVETDFIEYDQAMADREQARAEYNRVLDNSQEIAAAEANVQALENIVNEARIIAPFDGTVTEINYMSGEYVDSGSMAVQVDDLNNLVVHVDVSEIEIDMVEIGQQALITFDALPFQEYTGEITSISSAGSDESDTVEFRVTVSIIDADADIRPGFTAEVDIITSQALDALLVPTQSLRGFEGNYRVMVAGEDGEAILVPVVTGASSDTFTEIIEGDLSVGDQLIMTVTITEFDEDTRNMMRMMREMNGGGNSPPGKEQDSGNGGKKRN